MVRRVNLLRIRLLIGVIVLGCGACAGDGPRTAGEHTTAIEPATAIEATVVKVVDGDTLTLRLTGGASDDRNDSDEQVRLIGIDTPETKRPNTPVECFGERASANLVALLPVGTAVRLTFDVEARDRYDRMLAYVFRADDGLFVNRAQVEDGFAAPYRFPPNVAHADEISEAGRRAREADRGLWGECGGAHEPAASR